MKRSAWPAAVCLAAWAAAASAADLAKLDRTIAKEPAYRGQPKYCLLVFGPQAKFRAWLVQDGDALYVDRNGNGDLTEPGKRVVLPKADGPGGVQNFAAGDLSDGTLTHTGLTVTRRRVPPEFIGDAREFQRTREAGGPEPVIWAVSVAAERPAGYADGLPRRLKYIVNGDGLGYLVFADRPQDAPVVHLNGPWMLGLQDIKQRLQHGQPAMLQIGVGTPGIGPGTFSFLLYPDTIPDRAHPLAAVTFPAKEAGGRPVQRDYDLAKRCWGNCLEDLVQVPDEAGTGTAKVTLSFDAWKEGHVAPVTVEVPVVAAPTTGKATNR